MQLEIEHLRQDYRQASLDVSDVDANPFRQFGKWFQEAMQAELPEPNAMTLATATTAGRPSARIVLLKGFDEAGFVFFTNYESRKGQEMLENPQAALVFFWQGLERQVRIEGRIAKVPLEESTAYFQSRPKGSQIGAWASPQSKRIGSRAELEANVQTLQAKYAAQDVLPRPEQWGGFVVQPELIEFWQGRPSRLHDRIQYVRQADGTWQIERLAP